jgi:hypothetical protein
MINNNRIETAAIQAENDNRFIYAAILWRRIGRTAEANECERLVAAIAINPSIKLLAFDRPTILKL